MMSHFISYLIGENLICNNALIRKHTNIRAMRHIWSFLPIHHPNPNEISENFDRQQPRPANRGPRSAVAEPVHVKFGCG